MQINLTKTLTGLIPSDEETNTWFQKLKLGQVVAADFRKVRNYQFLRKYFALLNIGYDNWSPGEVNSKYGAVIKNFSQFRADVQILAGFYETWVRLDGSVRIVPKSISFSKMTEEEFSELYSKSIDVLLKYVYKNDDLDAEGLDKIVDQYLSFS